MEDFRELDTALHAVDDNNNPSRSDQHPASEVPIEGQPQVANAGQWSVPIAFDYEGFNAANFTEWAGNATRYEWKDEYGDVGPHNEELEKQLFQVDYISRAGHRLDRYLHTSRPLPSIDSLLTSTFSLASTRTKSNVRVKPVSRPFSR